jgi:hypothetical protein
MAMKQSLFLQVFVTQVEISMLLGMSFFYPYWTSCIQEQADTPIAASFSSALRNVVEDLFEGSRAVKLSLVPILYSVSFDRD